MASRDAATAEFIRLIRQNTLVNEIAGRAGELALPDVWLVSGCLFQTVWNVLAGEAPCRGIKDYDLFYFDASDTTVDAEERINRQAAELFADLDCEIDVRNQARVHTWYAQEFGFDSYPRLKQATDGIDHFLAVCCMVAIRPTASAKIDVYAPFGVDDVLNRVMRPNPWFPQAPAECYRVKAKRWQSLWPHLTVRPCHP